MKNIVVFLRVKKQIDGSLVLLIIPETILDGTTLIIVDSHQVGLYELTNEL